jgi:hypothetical protein
MSVNKKVSDAARELSKLGASKGGKARAEKLTPEERRAIAIQAIETRWDNEGKLIKATHIGEMIIGNIKIPCAVLEDGPDSMSKCNT